MRSDFFSLGAARGSEVLKSFWLKRRFVKDCYGTRSLRVSEPGVASHFLGESLLLQFAELQSWWNFVNHKDFFDQIS